MRPLELWGGHECSVLRIGDDYRDQTILQGHQDRVSDLELFAGLGIKALRYPVLWERVAPEEPTTLDFSWTDDRLRALKKLGIRPVIGLLHHGSGPKFTNLLDKAFPAKFAAYARAVAERYPWVDEWNPVNEPLTTARFSCLNGVWYPHLEKDEGAFWKALLNQVNGVRLAMKEIRSFNPRARLVQTEDLGYSHATPPMKEQAEFENQRRYITWDLLCGRVVPGHPLWARIASHGLHLSLEEIAAEPCPPDVLGANYYASSERLLDQRLEKYAGMSGADGPGDYANTDAARSTERPMMGLEPLLDMAWQRYGIPLVVAETHNVGTRDEQMRWIHEFWRSCEFLRTQGVRVEAVTAWALLGAFDWKTLGVEKARRYEVGVFDLGGGEPRATVLAPLLKALASGEDLPPCPALASPGWWRTEQRFKHDPQGREIKRIEDLLPLPDHRRQSPPPVIPSGPILITGLTGTLGRAFDHACKRRGLPHVMTERSELQLGDRESIEGAIRRHKPCAIINAAGFVSLEQAETEEQRCMEANAIGPENLAKAARRAGIPLVSFSSDMVFDGEKGAAYVEWDAPNPLNTYGRSKAEGERRVLAAGGKVLIVRTATFFSPHDAGNFAVEILDGLGHGHLPAAATDVFMSPTFVPDLVDAVLDLLIDGETGVWHISNPACVSWFEFAQLLAKKGGFEPENVVGMTAEELGWKAPRPRQVTLASVRGAMLSEVEPAVERFLGDTFIAPHREEPKTEPAARDPLLPEPVPAK